MRVSGASALLCLCAMAVVAGGFAVPGASPPPPPSATAPRAAAGVSSPLDLPDLTQAERATRWQKT